VRREAGPGMPRGVREPAQPARSSPWWFDYGACEVVRSSDGQRWGVTEVPELRRASRDRAHPVVDVDEVDRWVLAQSALK